MIDWKILDHLDTLESIATLSFEKPVAIFKHSTSCPISAMAKKRLELSWIEHVDIFYLDLISYRSISNAVASKFGIDHESPQLLVIHHGIVIYHGSHFNIDTSNVKDYVSNLSSSTV